jgi:hypothetical protein
VQDGRVRNARPVLVTDEFLSAPSPPETRPLPDPEDTYPCSVISEASSGYDSFADQRRGTEWGRKRLHGRERVTSGYLGRRERTDAASRALVLAELVMGQRCWASGVCGSDGLGEKWRVWSGSSRSSGLVVSGGQEAI